VNCLLIREIPFTLAIRLWDTYLAEGPRMRDFLTYVLAAFLLTWAAELRSMDFQVRPTLALLAPFSMSPPALSRMLMHGAWLSSWACTTSKSGCPSTADNCTGLAHQQTV
jgi:hypothetical protein